MRRYQLNYAKSRPQMYDEKSREEKAKRIIKTLEDFLGKNNLKKLSVLDVGASSGIIDNYLSKHFKKVVGIDIDEEAIKFAKRKYKNKNLVFKKEDALKLSFKKNSFNVVICTHVYEHVANPKKLFSEIYRVLKPNGICYLAAQNKLWPLEAHHNLLFLSYLPKNIADIYIKIFKNKNEYYEHPMTYWELKKIINKFEINDYTEKILSDPKRFNYTIPSLGVLSILLKYTTPTFFWLLKK